MFRSSRVPLVCLGLGLLALALILGALGFQYIGGYPPCEMCHWQRWPLIAAIFTGLSGAALSRAGKPGAALALAVLTILLFAAAGGLGLFHAGVEWHWWKGPQACTGSRFEYRGTLDLNARVVMCDVAAWRLFGLSLAGYNAIISLGAAAIGAVTLFGKRERA
jgi:disulfide bond formation protein DsbB